MEKFTKNERQIDHSEDDHRLDNAHMMRIFGDISGDNAERKAND